MKGKKLPEVVNGAMLVMEEVAWADPEDAKIWPKMLKKAWPGTSRDHLLWDGLVDLVN